MISLDQVLLLQKKVETAVEKISFLERQVVQLKSDNDALHTKCAELTKALDEKTELVSTLEANQGKIEEGILNALSCLDSVEDSILSSTDSVTGSAEQAEPAPAEPVAESSSDNTVEVAADDGIPSSDGYQSDTGAVQSDTAGTADTAISSPAEETQAFSAEANTEAFSEEKTDSVEPVNGQFDIF